MQFVVSAVCPFGRKLRCYHSFAPGKEPFDGRTRFSSERIFCGGKIRRDFFIVRDQKTTAWISGNARTPTYSWRRLFLPPAIGHGTKAGEKRATGKGSTGAFQLRPITRTKSSAPGWDLENFSSRRDAEDHVTARRTDVTRRGLLRREKIRLLEISDRDAEGCRGCRQDGK